MAKNQTVDKTVKIFSLSRFRVGCFYGTVSVDFSEAQRPNNHFESIVPIFNKDKNHTTKAFILQNEQHYYSKNVQFEKEKFEERILAAQEKNSAYTMMNPIPSSLYCQICKETYQQYQHHVNSKSHTRRLRASKANKYINELITHISKSNNYQHFSNKTKQISKRKNLSKIKKQFGNPSQNINSPIKTVVNCMKIHNNSTNIASQNIGTN